MKERRSGIEERKVIEFVDSPILYVPSGILNYETNEEYILDAVLDNPRIFEKVSPELYRKKEFVLKAAKINGWILGHLRNDENGRAILRDQCIVLTAMRNGAQDIVYLADITLLKDKKFLLKVVRYNPETLILALWRMKDLEFFRDREFIHDAVRMNWNVLLGMRPERSSQLEIALFGKSEGENEKENEEREEYQKCLQELMNLIKAECPEMLDCYRGVKNKLFDMDISSWPSRIRTFEEAGMLIKYRENLQQRNINTQKPVTVILYPEHDHNTAFKGNDISKILANGNQVLLFEISDDEEMIKALAELVDNLPKGQKITLILGGHGDGTTLEYKNIVMKNEEKDLNYYLNASDFANPRFTNLLHLLNIDKVIFESCSAGKNGSSDDGTATPNLADLFSEHVRPDCLIFAPDRDVHPPKYMFNKDGSINRPIYGNREDYTYRTEGKYIRDPLVRFWRWIIGFFPGIKLGFDQLFDFNFNGIAKPAWV
jgi:hypothetical protein